MDALLAQLPPDTTVVTVNRRLARNLQRAHDARRRIELGDTAWESPDILPWSAWLARLWEGLMGVDEHSAVVLDPVQEQAVWEQVIGAARDALPGGALLQVPQAARLAAEGWRLLHGWRIPLAGYDSLNDDSRAFNDWAGRYQALCAREGWVDAARLPDLLAQRLEQAPWLLPRHLLLAGFDELTPQQRAFLDHLGRLGTEQVEARAADAPGHCVRHAFTDAEAEVEACAAWVRSRLEQQPEARIGVVVPDLTGQRTRIARCFDDALRPGALLPGAGADPAPFNLSLGAPLLDQPLVNAALGVLELLRGPQPLERVGQLLRSPHLGEPEELPARALLDARLREDGELTVTLRRLLGLAAAVDGEGRLRPWSCPGLAELLARAREASRRAAPPRTAGGWAEHFSRLLDLAGWPGRRALDSAEHQVLGAWRTLLERFAAVELVERRLGAGAALARLRRLAVESPFQPEGDTAPVQVLGVLESGGARFDALWIMGLDDETWPAPVRPNPFLPYSLQRRLGLPHASAERELDYAARTLDRLRRSAPEVVLSSSRLDGDRELRPSPLITPVPVSAFMLDPVPTLLAAVRAAAQLEPAPPPVSGPPLADPRAPGGTRLFQLQAACPFRAYAELRLGAVPLGEPQPGLDPLERGSLMHRLMERVWARLGDSDGLGEALETGCLEGVLEEVVAAVLEELERERPQTVTAPFRALERRRLMALLGEWLALERARPPFTVAGVERERRVTFGGLELRLRMDRIDRLEDGRLAVIDYKSGLPRVTGWFDDRPDEPQLPLYAVTAEAPVAVLAFARVRPGECAFLGLSDGEGLLPGVETVEKGRTASVSGGDWLAMIDGWRGRLEALAVAFRAGDARVDPKHYPRSCTWCPLPALCRIHSLTPVAMEEESVTEAGDE